MAIWKVSYDLTGILVCWILLKKVTLGDLKRMVGVDAVQLYQEL